MKRSAHARRMARRHQRHQVAKLNLVSLMDIFTILVFFLLLNSGEVEVLQPDKDIDLPEGKSSLKPTSTLLVRVTQDAVFLGEQQLLLWSQLDQDADTIRPLYDALLSAQIPLLAGDASADQALPITVMGDKHVPYALLKRVIATCAATEFRDVSLAVSKIAVAEPSGMERDSGLPPTEVNRG